MMGRCAVQKWLNTEAVIYILSQKVRQANHDWAFPITPSATIPNMLSSRLKPIRTYKYRPINLPSLEKFLIFHFGKNKSETARASSCDVSEHIFPQ